MGKKQKNMKIQIPSKLKLDSLVCASALHCVFPTLIPQPMGG